MEKGWYRNASGAMLGTLKSGEVVALLPDKFWRYGYFDPVSQKRVNLGRKTQENLSEEAYCFYKPFPLRKIGVWDLIKYIISSVSLSTLGYIVLATLFSTLVGMIMPRITKLLYSDVLESGSLRLLLAIAVLYISTTLSLMRISGVKSLLMNRISIQMDISVQAATMARILSLPPDFFKNYSSGELTTKAQYINSLCSTLAQTFLSTGLTSLFSLAYISQIFAYARELVIPALCITLVTIAFTVISSLAQMKISKAQMENSGKMSGMTYQILTGIQKIKLSGSEKRVFSRWLGLYSKEAKLAYASLFSL
ncbi:MAG: ABC transporter transmembrane domain-containing protein [Eubacteriales bacterium]